MWVKDGNDVTLGAQADASASADSGTFSYIALFKRLLAKFPVIGPQLRAASLAVTMATDQTPIKVDGSGIPAALPVIVQKANGVTGAGGKTLAVAFGSNVTAGNSIVVVLGMGEVQAALTITLAVTDSLSHTYTQATYASQSTTLEAAIFYTSNILGGANTVTVTIAGASSVNTAIAAEVYEVSGLFSQTPSVLDEVSTGTNAGS